MAYPTVDRDNKNDQVSKDQERAPGNSDLTPANPPVYRERTISPAMVHRDSHSDMEKADGDSK